ncbi:MAG: disulfide bond formation protein DsbA, partial [Phototrophicales bacterium]
PLNAPALHASMIARCLPKERYEGFISLLFKTQETWLSAVDYKEALRQNAKLAGMSDEEFDSCMNNNELQQAIASTIQEASEKWSIKSTPSIIFNDGEKVV